MEIGSHIVGLIDDITIYKDARTDTATLSVS